MKITPVIIIYYLFVQQYTLYSMEYTPLTSKHSHDKFQINTIADIPKLSLANIRPCLNSLSNTERNNLLGTKNNIPSLTFTIALLDEDALKLHILTYMFDNDETSANIFFKIPLWYACKKYDEARIMMKNSSLKIQKPISHLFRLNTQQQKEIMEILTASDITKTLYYPRIVISEAEQTKIKTYDRKIQDTFFGTEDIEVITQMDHHYIIDSLLAIPGIGGMTGISVGGISLCAVSCQGTNLSCGTVIGSIIGSGIIGAIGASACSAMCCMQRIIQKTHKLNI